ncbi:MAG TPA: putative maltokinase, partial [Candidatus Binatus sp.]|nr:putative maltokinase [Candidatus Binatus sp.]
YLGDRDGMRTPMQWSGDRNSGFSSSNPQRLILPVVIDYEYHYQTVNVESQEANRHSLLWWMRRLVALRRQYKAFGRGTMEFLNPANSRVIAYVRSLENETMLVVANLSRFVQYVELDLSRYKGMTPIELFSHSSFPPIGDLPYLLTLGPHGFVWFSIEAPKADKSVADLTNYVTPRIEMPSADGLLRMQGRDALSKVLPRYLPRCRWFRSKAHIIRSVRVTDAVTLSDGEGPLHLAFVTVDYADMESEIYVLPLGVAYGDKAGDVRTRWPEYVIADVTSGGRNGSGDGVLYDATVNPQFGREMAGLVERSRRPRTQELSAHQTQGSREMFADGEIPEAHVLRAEQSNTSIVFGDRFIMKLFRKLEAGVNPDIEVGRFLTDRSHYANTPPLAGWIDYNAGRNDVRNLALMQAFVPNQGDAWAFTLKELETYFEGAKTRAEPPAAFDKSLTGMLDAAEPDLVATEMIGTYLHSAQLIGQRVAELHLAFMADNNDPDFAAEPYSALYLRSQYQSMRNLLGRVMRLLSAKLGSLPPEQRPVAQAVLEHRDQIGALYDSFLNHRYSLARTRIHGDLHLGQMLYTGKDFVIIDFEGEPARPLSERRRKKSPLRDVAGMLRSFGYASFSELTHQVQIGALGKNDYASIEPWARFWERWACWSFLRGYLETSKDAAFLPKDREELRVLLDAFILDKAVYELGYELDNRPDWVFIPLYGISRLVGIETEVPRPEASP